MKGVEVSGGRHAHRLGKPDCGCRSVSDHRSTNARLPPMRSALAPPLRIAGRMTGAMETIDAMKLRERANPRKKAQLLDARSGRGSCMDCEARQWRVAAQLRLRIWNEEDDLRG